MYEVLYDYASRPRHEYWFVIIGIPVSFLIVMRLRKNLKQDFSFKVKISKGLCQKISSCLPET